MHKYIIYLYRLLENERERERECVLGKDDSGKYQFDRKCRSITNLLLCYNK